MLVQFFRVTIHTICCALFVRRHISRDGGQLNLAAHDDKVVARFGVVRQLGQELPKHDWTHGTPVLSRQPYVHANASM